MTIVIKKLSNNVFDVFFGEKGWDDHARFEVTKDRRLHPLICPQQLPQSAMQEVRSRLLGNRFRKASRPSKGEI